MISVAHTESMEGMCWSLSTEQESKGRSTSEANTTFFFPLVWSSSAWKAVGWERKCQERCLSSRAFLDAKELEQGQKSCSRGPSSLWSSPEARLQKTGNAATLLIAQGPYQIQHSSLQKLQTKTESIVKLQGIPGLHRLQERELTDAVHRAKDRDEFQQGALHLPWVCCSNASWVEQESSKKSFWDTTDLHYGDIWDRTGNGGETEQEVEPCLGSKNKGVQRALLGRRWTRK